MKIKAAGTYKVDATSPPSTALGYVDKLWIDPNGAAVNGDVFVYIVRDPNYTAGNDPHQPGVSQLKEVDLTHVTAGHSGTLVEVRCTSHLGALGPIVATKLSDTLYVGGNVLHAIEVSGDIQRPVSITGTLRADLTCNSLHDLQVSGVGGDGMFSPPNITINSAYAHEMNVHQTLNTLTVAAVDPNGVIQITGGSSDLYNLSLPTGTGVISGKVSVAGTLRSAHLASIAEGGSLSVDTQLGYGVSDEFSIDGDVAGTLTALSVDTHFVVGGAVTDTGAITVNQSLHSTDHNFQVASIGGVDPNGLVQIGTLAGDLNFSQAISGDVHILGDIVANAVLSATAGVSGAVAVDGDVPGVLQVSSAPLSGTLDIQGDLTSTGEIYAEKGISGPVVIHGSLAGLLSTDPNDSTASLSGSLTILQDLTGSVFLGGDLHDPADSNNPTLLGGHIVVAGSFFGDPNSQTYATVLMKGNLTGPHPFFAVDYDGWTQGADWGQYAVVAAQYPSDDFQIYQHNTPAAHIWEISTCRGDANNDDVFNLADSDALVEAIADPHAYAYDYPGLGALAPDPNGEWTTGGSRHFHCDLDCSDSVDYLDLNAFMVAMTDDPNCFTDCPGGRGVIPNQAADLTGQQLLENVAVERYGNLWDLETQLAQYAPLEAVRVYWTAVQDYQYTLRAFPAGLNFPADPNHPDVLVPTEHKTLTIAGLGREFEYDVSVDNGEDPNVVWLTVDKTTGTFAHGLSIEVTIHRSPCATGAHAGYVNVGVVDPNLTSFAFDIPVTMTKPLTDPKIVACLEIGGYYTNDPNAAMAHAIAGLQQWRRVTDAAIVYNIPLPDAASIYATLTSAVPGMTIYPGVGSNGGDACNLDDPNHWADPNDPNDPNTVAGLVRRYAAAAGQDLVFLDNEKLLNRYLKYVPNDPNYDCDPNNFDLSHFANAMAAFQAALAGTNITVVWYPGVEWGSGECDPNNPPWVMSWTEDLIEQACLYVEPRLVSLSYGDHTCKNPNYNECLLEARAWEDSNCPAQPMFPIVWIGDPNDQFNCAEVYDYGCYWTWEQVNAVLAELRLGDYARQDAIFYPGYTDWELTGQHVADNLWDPNQ